MSGVRQTLRAYAELARVSNLPTVVSNVLVGVAIGAGGSPLPWSTFAVISVAAALFYVGGMALNDAVDASVDRRERPDRPIPSGRISLQAAHGFTVICFVLALGVAALYGARAIAFGIALLAAIVVYDVLHKRFVPAVILMGICRGLVYCVAAAAVGGFLIPGLLLWPAVALALYTTLVTLVARAENVPRLGPARWLALVVPLSVLPIAVLRLPDNLTGMLLIGAALLIWLARCALLVIRRAAETKRAVLGWLAGISLVDAYFLTLLERPQAAVLAVACFGLTVWAHRRILGT